jgi:hypothetical protein
VELLDEGVEAFLPQLTMGGIGGSEDIAVSVEKDDVFTGKAALRVAPPQRFNSDIKGWDFKIVEKPKAGEYRYLRFAWCKAGNGSIMIQFHSRGEAADWHLRYYIGAIPPPWESKTLSEKTPMEWQVVTRDLFQDWGARRLGGVAFSPLDGADGLFDHMLLGRTIEDLDRATAKAILATPSKRLADARLRQLWTDLSSKEDIDSETAAWALLAGRDDALPFLLKNIHLPGGRAPTPVDEAKAKPVIADLTYYRHLTREAAAEELFRLGDGVLPHLRKAHESAEGEAKERLKTFLDRWNARAGVDVNRLRRCLTVLKAIDTAEAKDLRAKIEKSLP